MKVEQNAVLRVVKGENVHEYHVPPLASISECYDVLREMLSYLFERVKADFENVPKVPEEQVQEIPVEQKAE